MKKLQLLLLTLFIISCSDKEVEYAQLVERDGIVYEVNDDKPFTGKTTQKLPDGKVILSGEFHNGKKSGEWIQFSTNGQKLTIENFDDAGNYDGLVEKYNSNGQLLKHENYSGGKLDGDVKYYSKDGKKQMMGSYKNGELDGKISEWYKNGNQKSVINYSSGKKDGLEELYAENGRLTRKANYNNNQLNGILFEYYPSGKIRKEVEYKNGKVNGRFVSYYENGNKEIEYNQDNGTFLGLYTEYNTDASVHRQYDYKASGKLNYGTWKKYWNSDWNIVKSPSTYYSSVSFDKAGKPSTPVKYFYQKNNALQSEHSYSSIEPDVQHGLVTWYSEEGGVTMKGNFNNGKRDGKWTTYYKTDNYVGTKVKEIATYSNGDLRGSYTFYGGGNDFNNPSNIIGNRFQTIWGYWKVTADILKNFSDTEYKVWIIYEDSQWEKGARCKYKMDYYVKHVNKKYSRVNSYIKQNNREYYDTNNNKQWRIDLKNYKKNENKISCR